MSDSLAAIIVAFALILVVVFNVALFQATDFRGLPPEHEASYRWQMTMPLVVFAISSIAYLIARQTNDH